MLVADSARIQTAGHWGARLPETAENSPPSREVMNEVARMRPLTTMTNPCDGIVVWSPVKSLWFTAHALVALVGGSLTFRWDAAAFSCALTLFTLCLGHSIGLHRLLIHRSFECSRWLEYVLVHLGTVVGMGGPFRMLYAHDIRDWSQRHAQCHAFFVDQRPLWRDLLWQLHCEMRLAHPPKFVIEASVARDRVYCWMQRTWMLQQVPWALLCFLIGSWPFLVWGISVRVTLSLVGHSLVGYLAHNVGRRDWHLAGHAVQGYNVPGLSLLTMGEAWHNNHHAFPGSARLGLRASQFDPGWWMLVAMRALGLVWNLKQPADLPQRPDLRALCENAAPRREPPRRRVD